jgi:hypothetical protein
VTEAVFGLVGVLVGSAITWGIEVWRARRTDANEARVAARLVADELLTIDSHRGGLPEFHRQRDLALQQEAWVEHRVVLARELTDEDWHAVREAYVAFAAPPGEGDAQLIWRRYSEAMRALEPLMSSSRRYWWQRLRSRPGNQRGREEEQS